jgi:hypothetical protein
MLLRPFRAGGVRPRVLQSAALVIGIMLGAVSTCSARSPQYRGAGPARPSAALCSVHWVGGAQYDSGVNPTVAMSPSGYVIEAHRSLGNYNLWYHLGKIVDGSLVWGPTIGYDTGNNPSVAIKDDGYIVEVHSDLPPSLLGVELYYRVGKIDPHAAPDAQTIDWLSGTNGIHYDGGKMPSIAMTPKGVIVEVHETNRGFSDALYYRVGNVDKSNGGKTINWASSIEYTRGYTPHIGIDGDEFGNVVEVHHAGDGNDLHYRRGREQGSGFRRGIYFPPSPGNGRYVTGNAWKPAVSVSSTGFVFEAHSLASSESLKFMTGQIDYKTDNYVQLSGVNNLKGGLAPAVATSGA